MEYSLIMLFGLGLLGIAAHLLNKIDEINKRTNGGFKVGPFLRLEWPSIVRSLILLAIAIAIRTELEGWAPPEFKTGGLFVLIGYCSQSILYKIFGKAEKKMNEEKAD